MIAKALRVRFIREKLYEEKMAMTRGGSMRVREFNGPHTDKSRVANRAAMNFVA